MVLEYVYSPHVDFFIDRVDRDTGYEMASFHIHHKYEIYYEIEGSRRYFIEDAAYIVNAGCVVLIGENQIHKTASLGDTASSRIVANFSREYLGKITDIFPEVDFFSIGTNDLTQYTLAIDRQNQKLDAFYDPHHPAVLAMIRMAAENAHAEGKWIGICGELGADLELTEEFLSMGLDELSVSPAMVLPLRKKIRETK